MATTAQPPLWIVVRARAIVRKLWSTGESYHAGAIDYAEYTQRNRALWEEAEQDADVCREVKRQLRTVNA